MSLMGVSFLGSPWSVVSVEVGEGRRGSLVTI